MPTLNWIGKDAVIKHHQEVPFHLIKDVPDLSCGDPGTGNEGWGYNDNVSPRPRT